MVVLVGAGCKKDEPASDGGASAGPFGGTPDTPARVAPVKLDAFGEAPGLLDRGAIFVAVRAGAAQSFLQQLPLPGYVTRELAEARRELGFDVLNDDVLARFSIPPDAVVSMTLGRPVGTDARKTVTRGIHHRDDHFLGLMARVMRKDLDEKPSFVEPLPESHLEPEPPPPPEPPTIEAKPIEESPPPSSKPPTIEVPGGVPGGVIGGVLGSPWAEPPPPPPPVITPAERREIDELLRQSDGMAMQFRFHVPTDDPDQILREIRTRMSPRDHERGRAQCSGLEAELCVADGHALVIARRDGKAVVFDLLTFLGRSSDDADPEARRRATTEALGAPPAKLSELRSMAGHASLYVDATAFVELFEHERVGNALRSLTWDYDQPREGVERRVREGEALRRMLDVPRLFDGVLANVHHDRERTQLQVTWPVRDDQRALAREVLASPPVVVPVPTLAALCDGSLLCARSRGLPSAQALGNRLGLGIYGDARSLEDAIDDADELAGVLILVATWPNALGTGLWHLPLSEARGPEAAMVRGLLDAIGRIQGAGLSVRRLDVGRRSLQAEYAAYLRVPANDMALVSTLLSMAEMRMSPTTVEGVDGSVMMLRIPEDDLPAVLMTRKDPDPKDDVVHGWLTVVDAPQRLGWLLGLATDDGQQPLLYAEIPELWRLVASVPEAVDELGFARTWASERSARTSLWIDDGQPHVLMEVARISPTEARDR